MAPNTVGSEKSTKAFRLPSAARISIVAGAAFAADSPKAIPTAGLPSGLMTVPPAPSNALPTLNTLGPTCLGPSDHAADSISSMMPSAQGLTLVHFSAQLKHILWDTSGA